MERSFKEYLDNNFTYVEYNKIESDIYWGIPLNNFNKLDSLDIINSQFRVKRFNLVKNLAHNTILEVGWTIIPIIILLFVALPSMKLLYYMENPLRYTFFSYDCAVTVIGHQWYWSYEYINTELLDIVKDYLFLDYKLTSNTGSTEDLAININYNSFDSYMLPTDEVIKQTGLRLLDVDNVLIVPVSTRLRFFITSADVIHSWALPSFGIKVDAVPGRLTLASTVILESGVFYGQCSEICGVGHGFMPIKIIAI